MKLTKITLECSWSRLIISGELSRPYEVKGGLRLGDLISTDLFNCILDEGDYKKQESTN